MSPQQRPTGDRAAARNEQSFNSFAAYDDRKPAQESTPLKRDIRRDEEAGRGGYKTIDDEDFDIEKPIHELSATQKLALVLTRLAAWACSVLLILIGIAEYFEYGTIDNLHLSSYIVAAYMIFFGFIFIICELTDWKLRKYFGLLFKYTGRGLAYIFCGSLCFGKLRPPFYDLVC